MSTCFGFSYMCIDMLVCPLQILNLCNCAVFNEGRVDHYLLLMYIQGLYSLKVVSIT